MLSNLVDKIIIDQEDLGRFINSVHPGAYQSVIKINFSVLDHVEVKPLGVYGSKSEIVKFLKSLAIVDDEMYDFVPSGCQ